MQTSPFAVHGTCSIFQVCLPFIRTSGLIRHKLKWIADGLSFYLRNVPLFPRPWALLDARRIQSSNSDLCSIAFSARTASCATIKNPRPKPGVYFVCGLSADLIVSICRVRLCLLHLSRVVVPKTEVVDLLFCLFRCWLLP